MTKTLIRFLVAVVIGACNTAPTPCECAENALKAFSGKMDQELAYECADHQNSLSAKEKMEYLQEVMKCESMKMK